MMKMDQESNENKLKNCTYALSVVAACLTLVLLYALAVGEYSIGWSASSEAYRMLTGRTVISPLAQAADPYTQAGENAQEVSDTATRETEENQTGLMDKLLVYGPAAVTMVDIGFTVAGIIMGMAWLLWWINQLKMWGAVPGAVFMGLSILSVRGAWDMLMNGDLFYFALVGGVVAFAMVRLEGFIGVATTFSAYVVLYIVYVAYQDTIGLFNVFQIWNVDSWTEWFIKYLGIDFGAPPPGGTEH